MVILDYINIRNQKYIYIILELYIRIYHTAMNRIWCYASGFNNWKFTCNDNLKCVDNLLYFGQLFSSYPFVGQSLPKDDIVLFEADCAALH